MIKTCTQCELDLPNENFRYYKSRGNTYQHKKCSSCISKNAYASRKAKMDIDPEYRAKILATIGDWKTKFPDSRARHGRRSSWKQQGIDPNKAEAYYIAHDGKCEICKQTSDKTLYIDHCHTTKEIRGMLCNSCNSLLGYAKDSVETLTAAIDYLNSSR